MTLTLAGCGGSADTAQSSASQDPQALAAELVDRYAVAVFERDQEALGDLLSDAYVLRRTDGTGYDRQGYIDALAEGSDVGVNDRPVLARDSARWRGLRVLRPLYFMGQPTSEES